MKLKKMGVMSMGVNLAVCYGLLGLLAGIVVALISLTGGGGGQASAMLGGFGVLAVVILPLMYAVLGFIGGLIGGLFMNLAFKITGGMEMDFE